MGIAFNADEVFEVALGIEVNGERYYRKAAEAAESPSVRNLLTMLAGMEVRHARIFADMRERMRRRVQLPESNDAEGEAAQYLRAVADGRFSDYRSDPSKALTGRETAAEVLHRALQLEKDSVLLYQAMREIVPEDLGKAQVTEVMKEEMSHIVLITGELRKLTGER